MKIKATLLGFLILVLAVVVILPSIYLILYNSQPVSVDLLFYEANAVNLGTLLLLTWLFASLIGFFFGMGLPGLVRNFLETRRLEKKVQSLETELLDIKSRQVTQNGK